MPSFRRMWYALPLLSWPALLPAQNPPPRTLPSFASESALVTWFDELEAERRRQMEEQRRRREEEARRRPPAGAQPSCGEATRPPVTTAARPRAADAPWRRAIITGIVSSGARRVGGANVSIAELAATAVTDDAGRYRLEIPGNRLSNPVEFYVRVRGIGFRPASRLVRITEGDSTTFDVGLCEDINRLEEIVVTGVLEGAEVNALVSITNTQHAGVDEGGIVKLHGRHLVMLRRGRLFTVEVGGTALRPIDAVDAYGPGMNPRGAWYDELLVVGDRAVVVGYSYARGGTEIGLFRIGDDGRIQHEATYHLRSNDYYSSRNYASRLIGTRLVFYTPLYFSAGRGLDALPAMRRWTGDAAAPWRRTAAAQRIYFPGADDKPVSSTTLHTVTACELAAADVSCESTIVIGPPGRVFYVSPSAVYVWMSGSARHGARAPAAPSLLVRLPLDGSAPSAAGVEGSPVDQFSFLESGDGHINVLVRGGAYGEAMWSSEFARGDAALLRFPLELFGDGGSAVPLARYRYLPAPRGYAFTNRFVGEYLLYGHGAGWGAPRSRDDHLYAVPWRGGDLARLRLGHAADRIEVMGRDAVVIGADERDLHFSGIQLRGEPAVAQRWLMENAAQGETRSHGFFYRVDSPDSGVIGLPIRGAGEAGYRSLFEGSASVLFVRNADRRFRRLGTLTARTEETNDNCRVSCVDWYGNARPIFLGSRVFALMGYEVVEGRIDEGGIREVRRISYAPRHTRMVKLLGGF